MPDTITTEEQYEAALKRIDEMMDAEEGTPEADELSRLADEVEAYEQLHFNPDDWTCTCIDFKGEDPFCRMHGHRRRERHAPEDPS